MRISRLFIPIFTFTHLHIFTLTLFLLCLSAPSVQATKRALVVGIGAYPAETGWPAIHGDNDVAIAVDYLQRAGFESAHIATLLNEQATYQGIQTAFLALIEQAAEGDLIYIHFSGHGQRITDVDGDEAIRNPKRAGYDEAWIPYDAHVAYEAGVYEGEHHLVDDEINGYLALLRGKIGEAGRIIVIADACHSEGFSRAVEDAPVCRGLASDFIIPEDKLKPVSDQPSYDITWVAISACRSFQSNFEYKNTQGALTSAIAAQADKLTTATVEEIFKSIKPFYTANEIGKGYYTPTPTLECPADDKLQPFLP